jgi:hypothetical protein
LIKIKDKAKDVKEGEIVEESIEDIVIKSSILSGGIDDRYINIFSSHSLRDIK